MSRLIILLLSILILPLTVLAANTVKFYDSSWNLKASIAIGSGTTGEGIYYDGYYFWIVDNDNFTAEQYYLGSDNAFHMVSSFEVDTAIGLPTADTEMVALRAITGDGVNLWISYEVVFCFGMPPLEICQETTYVSAFSRSGKFLRGAWGIDTTGGALVDYSCLTYDGLKIIAACGQTTMYFLNLLTNQTDRVTALSRNTVGIAFNDLHLATVRTGAGGPAQFIDMDGRLLNNTVNTVTGIRDLDSSHVSEYQHLNAPTFLQGEWYAVIHQ